MVFEHVVFRHISIHGHVAPSFFALLDRCAWGMCPRCPALCICKNILHFLLICSLFGHWEPINCSIFISFRCFTLIWQAIFFCPLGPLHTMHFFWMSYRVLEFWGNFLFTYLGYNFFQPRSATKKMTPKPENPKTHAKKHVLCNEP